MKYLNKIIEYGLYLLVFLLPVQTRWIIKAGEFNGGYFEYATYSLYATDILLILLLLLFIVKAVHSWIPAFAGMTKGEAGMTKKEIASLRSSLGLKALAMTNESLPPRNDKAARWLIGGLVLISVVSVFFAANKMLALYKFGWLILGLGLFWLVVSADYNRLKLIYAMLCGAFLQAVLGGWQFLFQFSFANKWLGLALHRASDLGTSVIEAVGAGGLGERWLRAYGGLDHPNMLGGMMAVSILLILYLILVDAPAEKSPALRAAPSRPNDWRSVGRVLKGFIIIFTAVLFFSFSRSAWLGLAIGLGIMMISAAASRNLKRQKGLAEIILVMGILLFILFSQYQNLIVSRLSAEGRLEEKSTSERLASYQESWQMIKNNWFFGTGLGNYTLALKRQMPNQESFYYQPTHNAFLLVWAEVGIVGLLFFIGLLFVIASGNLFRHSGRRAGIQFGRDNPVSGLRVKPAMTEYFMAPRNDKKEYAFRDGCKAAILVALIVMMSLDHWLWSLHFGVLFFWLVIGLTTRNP